MCIYLYTGTGAGKTTNALGLVVRMLGHGKKVLMIQFLKWNEKTGEYLFQGKTTNFELRQFGRKGWHGYNNLNGEDRELCLKGLDYVYQSIVDREVDLLILDEVNLATHLGLLTNDEVINLLNRLPYRVNVVLTGRYATKELMDRADFVNEIKEVKVPHIIPCDEGIQY